MTFGVGRANGDVRTPRGRDLSSRRFRPESAGLFVLRPNSASLFVRSRSRKGVPDRLGPETAQTHNFLGGVYKRRRRPTLLGQAQRPSFWPTSQVAPVEVAVCFHWIGNSEDRLVKVLWFCAYTLWILKLSAERAQGLGGGKTAVQKSLTPSALG